MGKSRKFVPKKEIVRQNEEYVWYLQYITYAHTLPNTIWEPLNTIDEMYSWWQEKIFDNEQDQDTIFLDYDR